MPGPIAVRVITYQHEGGEPSRLVVTLTDWQRIWISFPASLLWRLTRAPAGKKKRNASAAARATNACCARAQVELRAWSPSSTTTIIELGRASATLVIVCTPGTAPPILHSHESRRTVTAKLDYLDDLGVDALCLAPVFATSDPSAISYDVTDYFAVRSDFGSPKDLKRLVAEAHKRGIKTIIDFVPNHLSRAHAYFRDAEARGKKSPYYDWFIWDKDGRPTHYFDWDGLLNLNYDNPEVRRMMVEAFSYWIREYGVDGFRVDAAWGIRGRRPDFWRELEAALHELAPDVFLLAEASARDPFYVRNGFDAAYDWSESLGKWAWANVFSDPAKAGARLRAALRHDDTPPQRIARFLHNNDTGQRFISKHGPALTRLAATVLHTLPGIPIVYTGDEVGAEFEPYEDPPPLRWHDPHGLREHYRKLAGLRETLPALRDGSFTVLETRPAGSTFAFVRDAGGGGRALVVCNFGEARGVEVRLPRGSSLLASVTLVDELTGGKVAVERGSPGAVSLQLGAQAAVVLSPAR